MKKFNKKFILETKLTAILLLIVCIFSMPSHTRAETNLIPNPSVETGTFSYPDFWSREKVGNNLSIFQYVTNGQDGKKSMSINATQYISGHSGWFFKPINISPNTTHTYSEYYKATMPTEIYLRVINTSGITSETLLGRVDVSNVWKQVSFEFTTPSDIKTATIIHKSKSLGIIQTDNFSLVTKSTSTPPTSGTSTPPVTPPGTNNIVPNPSLETVDPNNKNLPLSWNSIKAGNNDAVFSYLTSGFTGSRSLQVKITNFTNGVAYYEFPPQTITSGKTYEFSVKYKSDTYAEIDALITMNDGSVEYQYLGVSYPSDNVWSTFTTRVTLPPNAKSMSIYSLLYSTGTLVTDDYSITPVTVIPLQVPIVTLTFDDFFTSFYDNAYPLFKKNNMSATMYLVNDDIDKPGIMTKSQLKEISDYGFEIGSHTVTHPHLPLLSNTDLDNELKQSKDQISSYINLPVDSFASPYGEYNSNVLNHIKQFYSSHRSVDVGYNTKDNFDKNNIKAMSVTSMTSPETVLGWVDEAIRNKAWLVLVYHDIVDNGPLYSNTPDHLDKVLSGLKDRGVNVKTNKKALSEILPQI